MPVERAHIRSRGAGAGWEENEIIPLCRKCHSRQHSIGFCRFAQLHPQVLWAIEERGWTVERIFGQDKLVRKSDGTDQ